jgi:hypothetical protein
MAIVMRTVRAPDGTDFHAFVDDGTVVAGDALFSGAFRRTETWVNVRSPGRTVSTTVFEPVGSLTYIGIHREVDDLPDSDLRGARSQVEQQVVA